MAVPSVPSAKVKVMFDRPPWGYFDVTDALPICHDAVRDELFQSICNVKLRSIDSILLGIAYICQRKVDSWKAPRNLQPILNACYQKKIEQRLEKTVYQHAQEAGIAKLAIAISVDSTLLCKLDKLSNEELQELAEGLYLIPNNPYLNSLQGTKSPAILPPIPQFYRTPKRNKKDDDTQAKDSQFVYITPSDTGQGKKRKRPGKPTKEDTTQAEDSRSLISTPPDTHQGKKRKGQNTSADIDQHDNVANSSDGVDQYPQQQSAPVQNEPLSTSTTSTTSYPSIPPIVLQIEATGPEFSQFESSPMESQPPQGGESHWQTAEAESQAAERCEASQLQRNPMRDSFIWKDNEMQEIQNWQTAERQGAELWQASQLQRKPMQDRFIWKDNETQEIQNWQTAEWQVEPQRNPTQGNWQPHESQGAQNWTAEAQGQMEKGISGWDTLGAGSSRL